MQETQNPSLFTELTPEESATINGGRYRQSCDRYSDRYRSQRYPSRYRSYNTHRPRRSGSWGIAVVYY